MQKKYALNPKIEKTDLERVQKHEKTEFME